MYPFIAIAETRRKIPTIENTVILIDIVELMHPDQGKGESLKDKETEHPCRMIGFLGLDLGPNSNRFSLDYKKKTKIG